MELESLVVGKKPAAFVLARARDKLSCCLVWRAHVALRRFLVRSALQNLHFSFCCCRHLIGNPGWGNFLAGGPNLVL